MTLAAGSRLGPYEILAPLGAGGMGEVYKARDSKLHRDVAIKVLPELFAADAERLARFQREAQVLAALNHPHIASIYGLEESGTTRALVLELVEGETLAERLTQGAMPVEEALAVAHQIADALEAAHEKGIVHRDLKPANVKLTPEGKVKVLDFGLAKALSSDGASPDVTSSPTITAAATQAGVVIGTAAYMSAEQARGKVVDKRTDIWAFGAVLYEMLTGKRCFEGETVSDVLAAVLRQDPDWSALPPDTPANVRLLLGRCLERDPKKRLRDIGDAWVEGVAEAPVAPAAGIRRQLPIAWAVAVLLALAAGFAAARWTKRAPRVAPPVATHAIIPLPPGTRLSGWASPVLALSRDGRTLAFVAEKEGEPQKLWVHRLDRDETRVVSDSDAAEGPFFSPDGQWIGFATDVSMSTAQRQGELRKYSLSTGLTQSVAPIPDYYGGSWSEDGSILVAASTTEGLWRIPADGGKPDTSAERVFVDGKEALRALAWPQLLPGGAALVTDDDASFHGEAAILDPGTRALQPLGRDASFSRYASDARLLMMRSDGTLLAAPFDARSRRITGPGVAVLRDVAFGCNGAGVFAVSETGSLVYATGSVRGSGREPMRLARVTEKGEVETLPFEPDVFGRVAFPSPDSRRLAVVTMDGSIWIYDLARGVRSRVPLGKLSAQGWSAIWSPDGESLAFAASAQGRQGWSVVRQKVDGSGQPQEVVRPGDEVYPLAWTPDGRSLVYSSLGKEDGLWLAPAGGGAPRRLVSGTVSGASVSPDGRWLAYDVKGTGSWEVIVERFPGGEGKIQIAAGGGQDPHWSADGRSIFYRSDKQLFRVRVTPGERLDPSAPEELFRAANPRVYAVSPDGKGFFTVVQLPDSGIVRELHLVTNWFSELERLAPAGGEK
ncbi:MAG: protein kinase [Thermoanaerobaculia bacterium]